MLLVSGSTVQANLGLLHLLEGPLFDAPARLRFVLSPPLGGVVLLPAGAVAVWTQIDRPVVLVEPPYPTCLPRRYSGADAVWLGPSWVIVTLLGGLAGTGVRALGLAWLARAVGRLVDGLAVLCLALVGLAG